MLKDSEEYRAILPNLDLNDIHWVIVGGESGHGARPMNPEVPQQAVPFFFKQWGGVNKKKNGRLLDGREWNELPDAIRNSKQQTDHNGQPTALMKSVTKPSKRRS